ncbi:MAG: nicotinamide-nucleotide adenylyltransferase [Betaproteobacteria bacterium]|nr:MAG: nicotinamide-nucleotide adenylyltransferase [Betaproteobacteria bacterium]
MTLGAKSVRLIAVVGAESTGKTTLTETLAQHFDGEIVPEYLREFCEIQQRTPTLIEQSLIVATQLTHEANALDRAAKSGAAWVICDTAPLQTAVYSEFVFDDTSLYPQALAAHRRYSHTLLLLPDIGWQADGLQRDGAQVQQPVTELLRAQLIAAELPFTEVGGAGLSRVNAAIDALSSRRTREPLDSTDTGAKSR